MAIKNRLGALGDDTVSTEDKKKGVLKGGVEIHFDNKDGDYETEKVTGSNVNSLFEKLMDSLNEKLGDDDINVKYISIAD